jgi:undecaprenyl-phosphate 4-deoxy-4-formamido-L-arabinose transferase
MGITNSTTARRTTDAAADGETERDTQQTTHEVSVVVPVYQGEHTLGPLLAEIEPLTHAHFTPRGSYFRVAEVVLVHDGAIDNSDVVMEQLATRYPFVRLVWLARNFGQHPATLAGVAGTTAEWVVTLDEDGQHDPGDIGKLLDRALETGAQLVYAQPTNLTPHGWPYNLLRTLVKRVLVHALVGRGALGRFNNFRLVQGEIIRGLAAYCGHNVYLDVALSWVVARTADCPVVLREEGRPRRSGHDLRRLAGHFGRLVLTAGTRPLRLISLLGLAAIVLAGAISAYALWVWLAGQVPVQGWTSIAILLCFFSGCTLFSLGVIAEYLKMVLSMAVGRPPYLAVSRPNRREPPPS